MAVRSKTIWVYTIQATDSLTEARERNKHGELASHKDHKISLEHKFNTFIRSLRPLYFYFIKKIFIFKI